MKLPEMISKRFRIRDHKIIQRWLEGETYKEIGNRYGLAESTIGRIIYKNRSIIKLDKDYEKMQRVVWIKRNIKKAKASKKDPADLIRQLREEIEGEKANENHTHIHLNDKQRESRLGRLKGILQNG